MRAAGWALNVEQRVVCVELEINKRWLWDDAWMTSYWQTIMRTRKVNSRSDVTRRSHKEHEELERRRLALKMLRDVRAFLILHSNHPSCCLLGKQSLI